MILAEEYRPDDEFNFNLDEKSPLSKRSPVQSMLDDFVNDKNVEIDAVIYERGKNDAYRLVPVQTRNEMESRLSKINTVEADTFGSDTENNGGRVGEDYLQLLGGPWSKQQYLYDYLRMHAQCWYAWNHDPVAKRSINFLTEFVFGSIPKIIASDKKAQTVWDDFVKSNKLWSHSGRITSWSNELSIYGEIFLHYTPDGKTLKVRAIDPSTVLEIVTDPEDIEKTYYAHVQFPTQYQLYAGSTATSKYIIRQVPFDRIGHYKINSVSNEKRGRSDLLPVLGWLKRHRDYLTFKTIFAKNQAAFIWDTTITGSPDEVSAYTAQMYTEPPAGSEFVHNDSVKRVPLNGTFSRTGSDNTADWLIAMVANGMGIPMEYYAIPLSSAPTKASAMIASEPVVKVILRRQSIWESVLSNMADRVFDYAGIDGKIEVTFPEIYQGDRSQKISDISSAEVARVISHRTASEMIAKELLITTYNYDDEIKKIISDENSKIPAGY